MYTLKFVGRKISSLFTSWKLNIHLNGHWRLNFPSKTQKKKKKHNLNILFCFNLKRNDPSRIYIYIYLKKKWENKKTNSGHFSSEGLLKLLTKKKEAFSWNRGDQKINSFFLLAINKKGDFRPKPRGMNNQWFYDTSLKKRPSLKVGLRNFFFFITCRQKQICGNSENLISY